MSVQSGDESDSTWYLHLAWASQVTDQKTPWPTAW